LIFQYRTEVEWHLREEHRSGTDEEADLQAELQAAATPLDWDRLQEIRSSVDHPSVSLLLATTPASSMSVLDVARLRQLADRARRRLPAEPDHGRAVPVVEHRLSRAVATAEGSPTDRGLAVLVNQRYIAIIPLPFEPRDRAVVDQTFATRDLEYTLQRFPLFRVVVLGHSARILEGRGRDLAEVGAPRLDSQAGRGGLARSEPEPRDLDELLDEHIRTSGTRPLVVIGDRRRLNAFRERSRHAGSITTEVHKPRTRIVPFDQLAQQALARWRRDQQDRVVAELQRADALDDVTWGLLAVWRAVAAGTAERIWVEHDFAHPGRIVPGTDGVQLTSDPAEPGTIDDLVDTLISRAHWRDARVDLLDKGALGRDEPIAVKLTGPDRQAPKSDEFLVTGAA
jgi:Bacterial archaeo-eukaryotic release factor family 3